MWFPIVCSFFFFLATGIAEKSAKNGIHISRNNYVQRNKASFESHILREFDGTRILISPREQGIVEDIASINDKDLITLRDLRLVEPPNFRISSLDSNLEYFSTRIDVNAGDLAFSGEIYLNEDTKPSGNLRYTLRNVKGSGLVGLGLSRNGRFISTNYFMNYSKDNIQSESTWKEEYFDECELGYLYFPEDQLKAGIRKVINTLLKKRFDAALARISVNDVFGLERSKVSKIKERFSSSFYEAVVDNILYDVNKQIEENNMTEVTIPDIESPFTYRVLGFDVNGQVQASEGWLRNLATLVRQGPVSLSFESGNFIIFGSLGMAELTLGYDVCAVKIAGIGPTGDISGTIGKNAADLAISINISNQTISLANFAIRELSDFDTILTGLGPFNWLASKISSRVIDRVKTNFIPTIEPIIKEQINGALANLDSGEIIKKIIS